mmetsp:Transcript_43933/g.86713  ORF Transcript_43933/g.86713 Transcript_43933/m.86713 type:complete len:90 (+) Transcript_43933:113-382(+)
MRKDVVSDCKKRRGGDMHTLAGKESIYCTLSLTVPILKSPTDLAGSVCLPANVPADRVKVVSSSALTRKTESKQQTISSYAGQRDFRPC